MKKNTMEVLKARWFLKDKAGNLLEDWPAVCHRVAGRVAQGLEDLKKQEDRWVGLAEENEKDFFQIQHDQRFLANAPAYYNIGTKREMGSACFILPVGDSIEEIYQSVRDGAIIGKLGGGIGMSFSKLRARDTITSVGGVASGALSFMTAFDTMCQTIAQGGKRRGAMMGQLDVWHPEILDFIDCKQKTPTERVKFLVDKYKISETQAEDILKDLNWRAPYSNFNISVKVSDDFLKALDNDDYYALFDPQTGKNWTGKLMDPRTIELGETTQEEREALHTWKRTYPGKALYLRARDVMDRIVDKAWQSGEPGLAFIDCINADNPVASLGKIENSNPCGEYWQIAYSSCNLGSINLNKFFLALHPGQPNESEWKDHIDWQGLAWTVGKAVRFLNGVMSINKYPIQEITDITLATRPIGLGDMGFADLLLNLGIRYGSDLSLAVAERLQLWIQYYAWLESVKMAKELGSFKYFKDNKAFFDKKMAALAANFAAEFGVDASEDLQELYLLHGVYNCQVTTIAPTGEIALIAECSGGIEPNYAFDLRRQDVLGTRDYIHWFKEEWETSHPGEPMPDYAVEAHDVTPAEHIRVQAALQKYCDNAISKTINLPKDATREDVATAYRMARELGLKSITVYRDGCREGVLLHREKVEASKPKAEQGNGYKRRPDVLPGATWKIKVPSGTVYVTVNWSVEDNQVVEVFVRENSGNEAWELVGRLLSVLFRYGVPPKHIFKQLHRTRGQSTIVLDGQILSSVAQAIAVVLNQAEEYFSNPVLPLTMPTVETEAGEVEFDSVTTNHLLPENCPDCGRQALHVSEGCIECINSNCGYNRCGGGK